LQRPDGHWVGELQGDTILESEYILLMAFLGCHGEDKCRKAAKYLLAQQQADGGWSNYPDGPFDLSVSVKAYFALKLTGHDPAADGPRRALVQLGERLPPGRSAVQVGRVAGAAAAAARARPARGGALDARALRRQRRPRGHLPADGLHRHRPALPGRGRRRP